MRHGVCKDSSFPNTNEHCTVASSSTNPIISIAPVSPAVHTLAYHQNFGVHHPSHKMPFRYRFLSCATRSPAFRDATCSPSIHRALLKKSPSSLSQTSIGAIRQHSQSSSRQNNPNRAGAIKSCLKDKEHFSTSSKQSSAKDSSTNSTTAENNMGKSEYYLLARYQVSYSQRWQASTGAG